MKRLDEDQIATLADGSSPMALIDTSDDDEDGLPDIWEEKLVDNLDDLNGNGAGPGPGSGTGDFDGDGLTDLDEYEETKTNPIVADTDSDGLSDGVETGTGTYVSATNTGTDPKNADSDGDGLLDGVETNSGTLVDEEDTGTDPNNADTDGDSYTDGGEVAGGTDPHDPNSKGAIPSPFLYVDFEADAEDLSENGYNGVVDGLVSFDVEGAPSGPTPLTGAHFTGGHIDFPDIDMNLMIRDFEDGSYTFACWLSPIGSAGGQGFMWGQTNQGIHNGIRNGGFLHSAHWGADWNAATVLEAEQWVHAAWVYDGATDTATMYLNGEIDGGPQAQRAPNGGGTFLFGGRNNGEIPYDGYVDDLTIWREALPQGNIMALAEGASPIGVGGPGASYSQNFDGFDDGTTDLEDGSVMTGAAASVQDGRLQLTIDQQGLGFSSFSVPALPGSSQGFTASFDYELYDSLGANDPADGFSFNYGDAPLGDQGQAEEGMAGRPGVTENISWEVDTWRNGDAEQGVNISGLAGGADLGQLEFTNGIILEDDSRKTGTIEISWNPAVGASFTTTGMTTNADFSNVETGAFVAEDGHNFIISARVGGANEDLFIDNLVITVDGTDDADRDGLPDYWEEKYGVDDPEADDDEDGLTNIEELEAR
ncbi:MAG: LamG-like jellyroll fold domain-containing protein, partial [Verrucomicrobiales bacterium]